MDIQPQFYLASQSPRRQQLLREVGYAFLCDAPHIDEVQQPDEKPADFVQRLAREKAQAVQSRHLESELPVLAADTIVLCDQTVLGKPRDAQDASRMLQNLSGRVHQVLTGVAVLAADRQQSLCVTTTVFFRDLTTAEIDAYIATGEPLDKAGAYGIQQRAAVFIPRIEGSYSNVVGLPLCETQSLLAEFAIAPQYVSHQGGASDE
jgi:nucleoside triphosphate pyrophosphatase